MSEVLEEGLDLPAGSVEPFLDHLTIAQPAAGAAAVLKPDATYICQILSARATLTTSIVVANRFPRLRILDGEGTVWHESVAKPAIAASAAAIAVNFTAEHDNGGAGGTVEVAAGVPKIWLPVGWQIELSAYGLDVGDQLSAVRLLVLKRRSG